MKKVTVIRNDCSKIMSVPGELMDLGLYYLGGRDYVNGLTVFERMMQVFMASSFGQGAMPVHVELFKLNHFVRNHCHMEVMPAGTKGIGPKFRDAAARIDVSSEAGAHVLLLFQENGRPVTERKEDCDRTRYIRNVTQSGEGEAVASFQHVSDAFDLLRGIVEVNQQLTKAEAKRLGFDGSPSWAYMTHYFLQDMTSPSESIEASFSSQGVVISRGNIYTTRTVRLNGVLNQLPMALCFFFPVQPAQRSSARP